MPDSSLKSRLRSVASMIRGWHFRKEPKIFCIGRNKTGTTSMEKVFSALNIPVGPQREAELLMPDWGERRFDRIIHYVRYKGVAFQDTPFSLPGTYRVMDETFPNSKFILTVRDSADVWYNSVTKFHEKKFGSDGVPTKEDLQKATYVYKGWLWDMNRLMYDTPEHDLYHEETLKNHYTHYNAAVIEYFSNKPGKLLVVNLKDEDAAGKISRFLNTGELLAEIPWENRT